MDLPWGPPAGTEYLTLRQEPTSGTYSTGTALWGAASGATVVACLHAARHRPASCGRRPRCAPADQGRRPNKDSLPCGRARRLTYPAPARRWWRSSPRTTCSRWACRASSAARTGCCRSSTAIPSCCRPSGRASGRSWCWRPSWCRRSSWPTFGARARRPAMAAMPGQAPERRLHACVRAAFTRVEVQAALCRKPCLRGLRLHRRSSGRGQAGRLSAVKPACGGCACTVARQAEGRPAACLP